MENVVNAAHREPWNKDKIVGQKVPFKRRDIWALACAFRWRTEYASWRSATWESTASSGAAISSA